MSKHTSGKWKISKDYEAEHCYIIEVDNGNGLIAEVTKTLPEALANALLISQAPRTKAEHTLMLEQLSDVCGLLETYKEDGMVNNEAIETCNGRNLPQTIDDIQNLLYDIEKGIK